MVMIEKNNLDVARLLDDWMTAGTFVDWAHIACCTCISPLMALRSYAENDAQRPLLEVKADSHVAVR